MMLSLLWGLLERLKALPGYVIMSHQDSLHVTISQHIKQLSNVRVTLHSWILIEEVEKFVHCIASKVIRWFYWLILLLMSLQL